MGEDGEIDFLRSLGSSTGSPPPSHRLASDPTPWCVAATDFFVGPKLSDVQACDAKEDDELAKLKDERLAVFPTAISDFKDHPKRVLRLACCSHL